MHRLFHRLLGRLLLGIEKTTTSVRLQMLIDHGAQIGKDVFFAGEINDYKDAPLLTIEDGATVARGTLIVLHDSALNNVHGGAIKFGRVRIGRECFVGANCTILCGVDVGARAIVGAHSLVLHDIPPGAVAAGVPARVVGTVEELAKEYAAGATVPSRSVGYMESPPWREIKSAEDVFVAAHRDFLRKMLGESGRTDS